MRSKLYMSYYRESDIYIRDKVKIILDLSNRATKKELEHATGIDISGLAANFETKVDVRKLKLFL